MVAPGQPVPKGGGRALLGKPYRIAGKQYVPHLDPSYRVVGLASWYGSAFHGRRTANGEVFDADSLSAAHPTMPLPSYARVTSLTTGRSVIVRVNDRGPFHSNRVLDMSRRTADMLGVRAAGIAKVQVEYVGPAPVQGDDTRFLMASYRGPASVPASQPETLVASATALPGVLVRGLFGSSDEKPAPRQTAAPVVVAAAEPAPAVAPTVVAAAEPVAAAVRSAVLPQPRPALVETTYATVASVDPAAVLLPVQVAYAEPVATVQPAAYVQPAASAAVAPMVFQVGAQPVEPLPQPPSHRSSYAEDRIVAAYAAVDDVGAGVGLADLTHRLESMAAPSRPSPDAVVVQIGLFRDPTNAARIAAAFHGVGTAAVDDVTVNGKAMKRVRISAAAGVSADEVLAAAARAGARGALVLR